jgi:hypothetical protein
LVFALMSTLPSRAERRSRFICKAAGVTCGVSLLLFLVFLEFNRRYGLAPRPWWLIKLYLLFQNATLAAGAACTVAAVFTHLAFKHRQNKPANPLVITGWVLMVFGGLLLLEGVVWSLVIEATLALAISAAGLFVWRAGEGRRITLRTWFRCLRLGLPTLLVLYVAGYFVLMDRSRRSLSNWSSKPHYFDSSLRMGPKDSYDNSGQFTILNFVFWPADKVYFRLWPRFKSSKTGP